jgi:flagellar L-ring protein precursor FlgH
METEKSYDADLELTALKELRDYLQNPVGAGSANTFRADPLFDYENEFEGEAEYERKDAVDARVTARILEIKPNGSLLLEARTIVQTDEEIQTILLSGLARQDDVSGANTIYSNQLFNLQVNVQHEGEMRRTTKKGWIPRVLETIFNF